MTDEQLRLKLTEQRRKSGLSDSEASFQPTQNLSTRFMGQCLECQREMEQEASGINDPASGRPLGIPTYCDLCAKSVEERKREEHSEWMKRRSQASVMQRLANVGLDQEHASGKLHLRSWDGGSVVSNQKRRETSAILTIERWLNGELSKAGIYLYGSPGLGKSHMAQSAARLAWNHAESARDPNDMETKVRLLSFETILKSVRSTFDDGSVERDSDVIARYKNVPYLFIEDLGASEKASDFSLRVMYEVINGRLWSKKPTFITSNFNFATLCDRIQPKDKDGRPFGDRIEAERIVERLVELCTPLELIGESYRK
jgi:DNA replication protein DnaC